MLMSHIWRVRCSLWRIRCGGCSQAGSSIVREWLKGGRSSGLMESLSRLVGMWILRLLKICLRVRIRRGHVRCRRYWLSWITIVSRRVVVTVGSILICLTIPVRVVISSPTSISLSSPTSSSTTAGIPVLTMRRSGRGLGDWRRRRWWRERKPLGTHDPSWRSHRESDLHHRAKATKKFSIKKKTPQIGAALEVFEAFRSDSSRVT